METAAERDRRAMLPYRVPDTLGAAAIVGRYLQHTACRTFVRYAESFPYPLPCASEPAKKSIKARTARTPQFLVIILEAPKSLSSPATCDYGRRRIFSARQMDRVIRTVIKRAALNVVEGLPRCDHAP